MISPRTHTLFLVLFVVMAVLILACLLYGVFSRRFTDKIVAANMVGSLTICTVVMLAVFLGEDYILDIGIVYALLSFLAVVVLCRVVTDHIIGKMRHLHERSGAELSKEEMRDAGAEESHVADYYRAAAQNRRARRARRKAGKGGDRK